MNHQKTIGQQRLRRRYRVSNKIRGTAERPRLCVFRTSKHIYAQIIDDQSGRTLASASTVDKEIAGDSTYGGNCDAATSVGKAIGQRALAAGVSQICFDRREFQYHGRVAALANAAREAGLQF